MATLASGIFNHATAAAQSLTANNSLSGTTAQAGTSGTSASSTSDTTISANDFLTLLVTEMKNQDPTATTDPNEYINQLVNVNSLEQLIAINQTLSSALGSSGSSSSSSASATTQSSAAADPFASSTDSAAAPSSTSVPSSVTHGNLSAPTNVMPAAQTVANALSGKSHT